MIHCYGGLRIIAASVAYMYESRAFEWPSFAEGFVLKPLSFSEFLSYRIQKWGLKLNLHKQWLEYKNKKIRKISFVNPSCLREILSLHRILKTKIMCC